MSTALLDANVLIALVIAEHEHHDRAAAWLAGVDSFAVCPVVEGALIRMLLRLGERADTARAVLEGVRAHPRCAFLADDLSYAQVSFEGLTGHRQVTDAYLADLAAAHGAVLATFDRALSTLRPDRVALIP